MRIRRRDSSAPGTVPGWAALVLWLACCAPCVSIASEQAVDDPELSLLLEPVQVTGSRIRRTDLEGPMPVDRYHRADIERMGANTLGEFFRYLPQALGPVSETFQSSGFSGASGINLRGIGIDNTLTLLNGKRISAYGRNGASEPFVDINAIPVSAIDRVEILTDGASAIYGAEAVAGVVNIILREDFSGLEVGGGFLTTSEGDGDEYTADVIWGWNNGDTSVLTTLSYFDKSPILARDRDRLSDVDLSDQGGPNFRAFNGTPSNYLLLDSGQIRPDPECGTDPNIASLETLPFFSEVCLFNFAWFQQLTYATERLAGNVAVRHTFSPTLSARLDLFLGRRDNLAQLAPTPVLGGFVPADHPNNSFAVALDHAARPIDIGNRQFETRADTFHLVAGIDGRWARWDWSADILLTGNDTETTRRNALFTDRYRAALIGQGGPDGNLYYNPFGAMPQNDPALIDWLTTSTRFGADTRERALEVDGSRFLGKLPGGPIGLAIGFQIRDQELDEFADDIERSGRLAGGSQITEIDADRDILAAYAELSLPLHPTLEAQLALRFDDYSDFGSTVNPKVALAWRPSDNWLLRTSYSTSFRPPTFTELFNPRVENSGLFVDVERCQATGERPDCAPFEYPVIDVGNADLDPEQGESFFAGVVWSPGFVGGLDLEAAYWRFEHTDRIIRLNPQLILDVSGSEGVTRASPSPEDSALGIPGRIAELVRTFRNSDELVTSGIDLSARYAIPTASAGRFDLSASYTFIDDYILEEALIGSAQAGVNFAGKHFNREFAIPRHRGNLGLRWQRGDHAFAATVHYIGGYEDIFNLFEGGIETVTPHHVDSHATLDLQYSLLINTQRTRLRLGCRNCFDRKPPVTFNFFGEGLFDYRGAMVYSRLEHRFW